MTGSGRRRFSKWDLKEDISPENRRDCALSNKDGSSNENESRDHMSGAEGMREESIPGFEGDGHYATRKATGLDGVKKQSQTYSSKGRGRSFRSRSRSRSKSRSRSRSPARNPRWQTSLNDQSSRSGHTTPLCRDFAAGRCRKGDRCNFAHHDSLGRHLDTRVGSDRESMKRDDKALRSHSNTYSTVRKSANICNDFLKGRCRRGASCKFPHRDPGSDELRKGTADGCYQDRCSYDQNELVYTEKKSPDDWQPKHNGMHEVLGHAEGSNITSSASMPKARDWDEEIVQEASTEICYATELMQADASGDYIQQNLSSFIDGATGMENDGSSYTDLSVSSNIPPGQGIHQLNENFGASPIVCVIGVQKSQTTFTLNPTDGGIEMPCHHATFPSHHPVDSQLDDITHTANADVSQTAPCPAASQNSILGAELSEIPHPFTTLSHLFDKKEQLSQLYAAMDGVSHIPNSSAYVPPVTEATSLLNQATKVTQQYDPMFDIETKMISARNELMSSSVEQRSSVPGMSVIPSLSAVTGEICLSGDELGHQSLDQNKQESVSKEEENEGGTGKGTNDAQEQGPGEDVAVNEDINDDNKPKDAKEMRPFKFALAEFVKELLKPAWKEGKMSKEVYKTIVKKVVDKVAIQETHIPGTKEKIDQYLSFSKPKLTKLVQAYLERYKKN